MFGLIPYSFRFRGKQARLQDICACFADNDHKALHPTQIAKRTGMSMAEVDRRLALTPELFVKLPRRPDGLTRYRLTSAMAARDEDQLQAFISAQARRESMLLYAVGVMLLLLFLIVIVIIGPAL